MTSFFTFSSVPVEIEIKLQGEEGRRQVEVKGEKEQREQRAVYYDGESVSGQVNVRVKDGKKYQHDGIRIELIGSIGKYHVWTFFRETQTDWCETLLELFYDRGNHYEFVSLSQELAAAGELRHAENYDFIFKNVEKQYESYAGINVRLRLVSSIIHLHLLLTTKRDSCRYYLRVSMNRVSKEKEFWVHSYRMPPEANSGIRMEVGIEDCLHIEFEYNKAK